MSGETEGHVRIFDTTLRDGEQSPGASMTASEKLEIALTLARLGVGALEEILAALGLVEVGGALVYPPVPSLVGADDHGDPHVPQLVNRPSVC